MIVLFGTVFDIRACLQARGIVGRSFVLGIRCLVVRDGYGNGGGWWILCLQRSVMCANHTGTYIHGDATESAAADRTQHIELYNADGIRCN